jgi:DNA-binding GntR family transcriptional regulator
MGISVSSKVTALASARGDRTLLADKAVDHIRALIAAGHLGPGDRVNEVEIAMALEISRGPVREAVRRLAAAGLVVSEPNFGSRLVQIDEASIRSLYEVREALEALAARLATERMSLLKKRRLVEMLDQHEAAMDGIGSDAYPAGNADWDFHLAVLAGSGNAVAWRVCGNDLRDMFALLRRRHGRTPGRGKAALQEHRRVAEAILSEDADIAAALMAQHIRNSYRNLLALLRQEQETESGREAP